MIHVSALEIYKKLLLNNIGNRYNISKIIVFIVFYLILQCFA